MALKCGVLTTHGEPCRRRAGWGTEHYGYGPCKTHDWPDERRKIEGRVMWGREFSTSLCEDWLGCPQKTLWRHHDRLPGTPPAIFEQGRALHDLAERYGRHCWELGVPADRMWGTRLARAMCSHLDDAGLSDLLAGFVQNVTFDWSELLVTEAQQIEALYTAKLPDGLGTFIGHPDLVSIDREGVCHIRDWKTHWHAPTEAFESFDDPLIEAPPQLQAYAWLLLQNYPDSISYFRLHYHYVRHDYTLSWTMDPLQLEELVYLPVIRELAAAQKAGGPWRPDPGYNACGACPYVSRCTNVSDLDQPLTAEEAREMYGRAEQLRARANMMMAAVRRFASDVGPFRLHDGVGMGFNPEEEYYVIEDSRSQFCRMVREDGYDPDEWVYPQQETLAELLDGFGAVPGLGAVVRKRKRLRWGPVNLPTGRVSRLQLTDKED